MLGWVISERKLMRENTRQNMFFICLVKGEKGVNFDMVQEFSLWSTKNESVNLGRT